MTITNLNIDNLPYDKSRHLTWTVKQRRKAKISDECVRVDELIRTFQQTIDHWFSEQGMTKGTGELEIHLECCQMLLEDWRNDDRYKNDEVQYEYTITRHLEGMMDMDDKDDYEGDTIWEDCENFLANL